MVSESETPAVHGRVRAVHGRVNGRVQGVSFRASMQREARRRALVGWVRNDEDGSVEFLIQGDTEAVQTLLDWAHRGPPGARVHGFDASETEASPQWRQFDVTI